jgi:hypothetical protein
LEEDMNYLEFGLSFGYCFSAGIVALAAYNDLKWFWKLRQITWGELVIAGLCTVVPVLNTLTLISALLEAGFDFLRNKFNSPVFKQYQNEQTPAA